MPETTESSDEEWEEVEESQVELEEDVKPAENVEVEIVPAAVKKKWNKEKWEREMFETAIRRAVKKLDKETHLNMHKVHLLCLLALGMRLNRISNSEYLKAYVLSILPERYTDTKPKHISAIFLTRFIQDFIKFFEFENGLEKLLNCGFVRVPNLENLLRKVVEKRKVQFKLDLVLIFIAALRTMGFNTRLVLSLQPLPFKPPTEKQKAMLQENAAKNNQPNKKKSTPKKRKQPTKSEIPQVDGPSDSPPKRVTRSRTKRSAASETKTKKNLVKSVKPDPSVLKVTEKKTSGKDKVKANRKSDVMKIAKVVLKKEDAVELKKTNRKNRNVATPSKKTELVDEREEPDETPLTKPLSQSKTRRSLAPRKTAKRKITSSAFERESGDDDDFNPVKSSSESDDSDFEVEKKKTQKKRRTSKIQETSTVKTKGKKSEGAGKSEAKKVSSRRVSGVKKSANSQDCYDQWLEVYSEQEGKWICLDIFRRIVNHPQHMEKYVTPPMHYVLGFDNDHYVKDVTAKYSSKWLTDSRKLRVGIVDKDWWKMTLAPYSTPNTHLDTAENKEMQENLLAQPIPTTISAFKNHPLFGLRRHLLKYEAIYPEDIPAVGIVRGEEVYPRSAIHTLHTRDKWLQEARVVKEGEKPYKMVASLWINWKLKQDLSTLSMPLFGRWQTEPYVPPVAKNGKVPRNQYGNVDLFQPGMLPVGCIQIRLPGLHKIARKLNIDIAQAITGFDSQGGYPHPVTDGYVICKEFEETLTDAWKEDQVHAAEREKKKREERVYGHWKLFIKAVLAKERIKKKYAIKEKVASGEKGKGKKATLVSAESGTVWQAKRLKAAKSKARGRAGKAKKDNNNNNDNLFPFETEAM